MGVHLANRHVEVSERPITVEYVPWKHRLHETDDTAPAHATPVMTLHQRENANL